MTSRDLLAALSDALTNMGALPDEMEELEKKNYDAIFQMIEKRRAGVTTEELVNEVLTKDERHAKRVEKDFWNELEGTDNG